MYFGVETTHTHTLQAYKATQANRHQSSTQTQRSTKPTKRKEKQPPTSRQGQEGVRVPHQLTKTSATVAWCFNQCVVCIVRKGDDCLPQSTMLAMLFVAAAGQKESTDSLRLGKGTS